MQLFLVSVDKLLPLIKFFHIHLCYNEYLKGEKERGKEKLRD